MIYPLNRTIQFFQKVLFCFEFFLSHYRSEGFVCLVNQIYNFNWKIIFQLCHIGLLFCMFCYIIFYSILSYHIISYSKTNINKNVRVIRLHKVFMISVLKISIIFLFFIIISRYLYKYVFIVALVKLYYYSFVWN